jgi:hypothetical protein
MKTTSDYTGRTDRESIAMGICRLDCPFEMQSDIDCLGCMEYTLNADYLRIADYCLSLHQQGGK